jgi:hypothetical protein
MNLKQFLKPDWEKIVIWMIFLILSFMAPNHLIILPLFCGSNFGIPLPFYCSIKGPFNFNAFVGFYFLADAIFWYFISCLIVWIYDKFKKKPQ